MRSGERLRKYGEAQVILFELIDQGALDFEATPVVHAAGDTQISKDEGPFVNTTNAFAHEGNGIYSITLTATEMEAARISVTIIDQGAKAWEDQVLFISTYGNASAQHAFDLDTASAAQTGDNYTLVPAIYTDTNELQTDLTDGGRLDLLIDAILTDTGTDGVVLANGAITAAKIAADAIGASELAADAVAEIADAVLEEDVTDHSAVAYSLASYLAAILTDTGTDGVVLADNAITAAKIDTDAIDADALKADAATEIADALLTRDWTSVTGEAARSVLNALRFLRNKWSIAAGTLTVTEEDDSTAAWTAVVTDDATADNIIAVDPA